MPEQGLLVRLDALANRSGEFTLTSSVSCYPVTLHPERSYALSNWLKLFRAVLSGQVEPDADLTPLALMREIGIWLWNAMLPATAPAQEREALAQALREGLTPILLVLLDALSGLPWELLYDPSFTDEQGFLSQRRPLLRFQPSETKAVPIPPPLRVLVLISSPLSLGEDSRVDVESERAAIEEGTREAREAGLLHLLIEDFVAPERVQQALVKFKPHLLHYIGHGGYDEERGGVLLWEDEQGRELAFSDGRLARLLRPRGLAAVVLHACKTGNRNAHLDVQGVAGTLIRASLPTVLAQQGSFSYESSQRASRAWYNALTSGQTLAEALFEVRQALALSDRPDWAIPVLSGTSSSLVPFLDTTVPVAAPDPSLTSLQEPGDFPAPIGVFVGRHTEMRGLRLMLESRPGNGPVMALLLGPGGVGKSTLAAQAVARYGKSYKGILTLSCQKYQDIGLLLQQIGEFLRRQGAPAVAESILPNAKLSIDAKIEETVRALNQAGPFILVIDNLESVQNEDQTLCDPGLLYLLQKLLTNLRGGRVFLTGRYAIKGFPPQEKFTAHLLRLDLDDLSAYEIDQLLNRHGALAQLGDIARATLIQEFGGLPYVYDLLSSHAATQNLEQLIFDIHGRITTERKQRSAEKWHEVRRQVVEFAALEVTVERLAEPVRRLLAQLSMLQQPFPLEAIEQGLAARRDVWQPLLDWSLLRSSPFEQTYHLHSLTSRYAEELLEEQEQKQVQTQLGTWYEQYSAQQSHALSDYLEARRLYRAAGEIKRAGMLVMQLAEALRQSGLYALLRSLCVMTIEDLHGQDDSLTASSLQQLGIIAQNQGDYGKARQLFQQSLQISERLGDLETQANDIGNLGIIAQEQGSYVEARRLFEQSLAISEQLGGLKGKAAGLHNLGVIAQGQGDYAEARQLYQQSLAIKAQLGDLSGKAASLLGLGQIAQLQGDYAEARQLYQQSLAVFEQLGDLDGKAHSLEQLGVIAQKQGNYVEARQLYQQSLAIGEQLGDLRGKAGNLHSLGQVAQKQGNYAEARQLYQQSLAIRERLGDLRGKAASLEDLGTIAQDHGSYGEARQLFEQSLAISEQLGNISGKAAILHQLGRTAQLQGDYAEARQLFEQSLAISEQLGDLSSKAAILHNLGTIAQEQGNYVEAQQLSEQSLAIREQLGDLRGKAYSLGQLGVIAQLHEDYAEARRLYQQGLAIFEQLGDLSSAANSLHHLGLIAQLQGDYAEARQLFEQSLAIFEQLENLRGKAYALTQLGSLLYEQGDVEPALTSTIQAFLLLERLRSPARATNEQMLARIHQQMDERAFIAQWQAIAGDHPLPPHVGEKATQQLVQTAVAFMQAPTWAASQQFLEAHPELLHPRMDDLFTQLATQQKDEKARHIIKAQCLLLRRCREVGIDSAFQENFLATLNNVCGEVITVLRAKNAERTKTLASQVEQMAQGHLPVEEARNFLYLLITLLRGQEQTQLLAQRAEGLHAAFRRTYEQLVAAVEQGGAETPAEAPPNEEEGTPLPLEALPGEVALVISQGTAVERRQVAAILTEAQDHLSAEDGPVSIFLECLVARLNGEMPDVSMLEEPFTDLWQELESLLSSDPKQAEE